jgi:hypothetical protein
MASATCLIVSVDTKSKNTPVTLTVQDADINDVLSALFNATDNTYQLQTGIGISGKVDALQLTQTPFDDAVKAILANVNHDFTYDVEDGNIYYITNTKNVDTTSPIPKLYVPTVSDNTMVTIHVTLPTMDPSDYITAAGNNNKNGNGNSANGNTGNGNSSGSGTGSGTGSGNGKSGRNSKGGGKNGGNNVSSQNVEEDSLLSTSDTTGKDDQPATEECFLAMIQIHNQPVHVFAVGFNADELPDFSTLANPGGTTSGSNGYGYGGMTSGYGSNSGYGSSYPYGTTSPYGSSYPYGTTSPYGSSYPYGTTSPYGSSYPYGTTSPYGSSYPYGTTTTTTSTGSTTSGTR